MFHLYFPYFDVPSSPQSDRLSGTNEKITQIQLCGEK